MPKEMPKTFDFNAAESRLYQWWEDNGWFKPEIADPDAEPFVISIPPPNVTGELHQGHALFVSLEDLMTRYERMRGKAALWVPGTDHAGIATQLMVERMLESEGTSRQAVGRDAFLERTWAWKEKYGGHIVEQLRRLGASCDWDRLRFTMDDGLSEAVREAFVTLWEQGLIYRGPRLVNWSPRLQTAVSDLEVEYEDRDGTLYYFKYVLANDPETFIPVATTRPETILGDTAVAVHPEDERYRDLIGKDVLVPILNRRIPVIGDEYVDREFGTGALKITPGHDPHDYEIGERHNLPVINILNKDVTLNDKGGPYAGLDRFDARKKLWADMAAAGLVVKEEPYRHSVPISQRGGELVEPLVSEQWFVKIQPLAEKAIKAVQDGRITIVPERFEKVYFHWMENIRDWCISRQLWWGHRIPAWYNEDGEILVSRTGPDENDGHTWRQDDDVLDTWFSSGLWPFSTLGWPEQTDDLARYYPTDVMETGYDILFFWVARMIMMGLWFTDEAPFHTVYLHGLVRDGDGQKMSKTKGNVIDPIQNIDEYGTDSLRFTLLTGSTPGQDMNLSEERIRANRNFGNKIWQMARFITSNLEDEAPLGPPALAGLTLPDCWILSRLHTLIADVQRLFDTYQYGEAGRQIYDFLWSEFADWYIEISKEALYGDDAAAKTRTRHILVYVLETCLRLLHPYIPFVTEEIWQYLPHEGETLMLARWPEADPQFRNAEAEDQMRALIEMIRGIRNARAEYDVDPGRQIAAFAHGGSYRALIAEYEPLFGRLARVEAITFVPDDQEYTDQAASIVVGDSTLYLPLAGMVDLAAERERLTKEMDNLEGQLKRSRGLLGNPNFVERAKPEVVEREQAKLEDLQAREETLRKQLDKLSTR